MGYLYLFTLGLLYTCLPEVGTVHQLAFKLVLSVEAWHVSMTIDSNADHDGVERFRFSVASRVDLPRRHRPATSAILLLFHRHHFRLKPDVLLQPEMIRVQAQVLEEFRMVHVVREVGRNREVAVASHFFHRVRNS